MDNINDKVCVTGASGFLASWIIKHLLLAGYHIVGTVRDPGNEKKILHLMELEGAKERLRITRASLMEEGSFDDAIKGCHGVFHTASPVVLKSSADPKVEMVEPAVEGTMNVLRSCKKNPSLRRVVITSSTSTVWIRDDLEPQQLVDESSWSSVQRCERLQIWYALSKTLSEKAAWDFCNQNGIDLVTILPSFIIGPSLSPDLSLTGTNVLGLLKGGKEAQFMRFGRMGYVHIEDIAQCHVLVYEHENAQGRYICNSIVMNHDELASFVEARYPWLPIAKGGTKVTHEASYNFDNSKIKNLGFEFKSIEEMFDDCVESLVKQGHLCS